MSTPATNVAVSTTKTIGDNLKLLREKLNNSTAAKWCSRTVQDLSKYAQNLSYNQKAALVGCALVLTLATIKYVFNRAVTKAVEAEKARSAADPASFAALQKKARDLETRVTQAEKAATDLAQVKEQVESQVKAHQERIAQREKEIEGYTTQIANLTTTQQQLEQGLANSTALMKNHNDVLETLNQVTQEKAEIETRLQFVTNELEQIKAASKEQISQALTDQLNSARETITELQNANDTLRERVEQAAQAKLLAVNAATQQLQAQIDDLRRQVAASSSSSSSSAAAIPRTPIAAASSPLASLASIAKTVVSPPRMERRASEPGVPTQSKLQQIRERTGLNSASPPSAQPKTSFSFYQATNTSTSLPPAALTSSNPARKLTPKGTQLLSETELNPIAATPARAGSTAGADSLTTSPASTAPSSAAASPARVPLDVDGKSPAVSPVSTPSKTQKKKAKKAAAKAAPTPPKPPGAKPAAKKQ